MAERADIRNVAIIAHVDHGKTTLVDAMLWQSGAFRENEAVAGSRAWTRTTSSARRASRSWPRTPPFATAGPKINIIDTPGHADFGGEVERGLTMVDGVLLLVDASEGPLPQTRFVLRKALESQLHVIVVVNKIDRPDARIAEVVDEVYELFLDLDADEEQIEFPIVYTNARAGHGDARPGRAGRRISSRCSSAASRQSRRPTYEEGHPLQALVTNLDASPYVGRLALCRMRNGALKGGRQRRCVPRRRQRSRACKVTELYVTEGLDARRAAEEAGPGEIIAIAGIADVTIGETLADPDDPRPLP